MSSCSRHRKRLAAQLASQDLRRAREACAELAGVLWPGGGLPRIIGGGSPLGRVMARTFGTDDAEPINQKRAAVMLGVHRGTVARFVSVGVLERHPQGGIRRSPVLGTTRACRRSPAGAATVRIASDRVVALRCVALRSLSGAGGPRQSRPRSAIARTFVHDSGRVSIDPNRVDDSAFQHSDRLSG